MRSLSELNEGLNDYLKQFCEESKKSVESELAKTKLEYAEKIETLHQQIEKTKKLDEIKQEKFEQEEKVLTAQISQCRKDLEKVK